MKIRYKMKIVVPSNDNKKISKHFGKSKGFVILQIENDKIISREYRENDFTGHAKSAEHNHENHHHHDEQHSHEGIFRVIGDCDIVIGGGMGRRLYNDFKGRNIEVYITEESDIDSALQLYLENRLDNNEEKCCEH